MINFRTHDVLIPEQSGYRQGHSCETALNLLLSKWKSFVEQKHEVLAVFLDFKSTFETISRLLIRETLNKFGIQGVKAHCFANYLEGRTQTTSFMNSVSDPLINTLRVPQGSVLGPILFTLYINDMKKMLRACEINLFQYRPYGQAASLGRNRFR